MSFLSSFASTVGKSAATSYKQLQGPTGGKQSASETIDKLCDRLANGTLAEDRRAALLGLKGMSRDWKGDVGQAALPILLIMLERDAPEDLETAKAVLETLNLLCEVDDKPEGGKHSREPGPGLRNTDRFLSLESPLHALLFLLGKEQFYVRFFSLQLLGTLLANRPEVVQKYVLKAPGGSGRLVEVLDDKREIIRNEGLLLFISLLSTNAEIQKIVAFEGAFDRLFNIINSEGGIASGGIVVQDCLSGVAGLLRYNVSNQNYFRETSCIPQLTPLLLFPPSAILATPESPEANHALDAFAFQEWPQQKTINAQMVLHLIRTLMTGAGEGRAQNQRALLAAGLTHCLIELALASTAPPSLKTLALNTLADILSSSPQNQDFLSTLSVMPLIPATGPDAQRTPYDPDGKTWQRARPVSAVLALVGMAIEGEPGSETDPNERESLKLRAAAVRAFEGYVVGNPDAQVSIVTGMSGSPTTDSSQSAGSLLLAGLKQLPTTSTTIPFDAHATIYSCLLFCHLLRNTEACKRVAREVKISEAASDPQASPVPPAPAQLPGHTSHRSSLDVGKTGPGSQAGDAAAGVGNEGDDDDDRIGLVHVVVGNLMMAQREQSQLAASATGHTGTSAGTHFQLLGEWSRVMVGYLMVLCVWMWESPRSVREFLSEGSNLQVLIQPITQASGVDSVVQGLCAFLLGIVYEYNREPGSVTRATLHPILQSRVGPDVFANRILRLREDVRFKNVGPDILEITDDEEYGSEDGIWFDWAFVEFLKNNYLSVQRSILLDPGASDMMRSKGGDTESLELIVSLRNTVTDQKKEIDDLRSRIVELAGEQEEERETLNREIGRLVTQLSSLQGEIVRLKKEVEASQLAQRAAEQEAEAAKQEAAAAADKQAAATTTPSGGRSTADDDGGGDKDQEQEDLLVLLEELSSKRKADKAKMRAAGLEVSEDEDDDEEGEGEGDDA